MPGSRWWNKAGQFIGRQPRLERFLDRLLRPLEFVIKKPCYKQTVVKAITGKGLSVPELVREYENQHNVSEARRKVGKELMK